MANNNFNEVMNSLFEGIDNFVSAKTVVGEPVVVNDTTIIPLVDMSFGMGGGAGASDSKKSSNAGGGVGGKISPSAVLIIKDGSARIVNVKNQDTVVKVLDMVPDFVDRFMAKKNPDPEVDEAIDVAAGRKKD